MVYFVFLAGGFFLLLVLCFHARLDGFEGHCTWNGDARGGRESLFCVWESVYLLGMVWCWGKVEGARLGDDSYFVGD